MTEADNKHDLGERIAILEERTKPKEKTFPEKLRDYGGLAALVITVAYSWPLGIWDRFIMTPQQKREARVAELKSSLTESAKIIAESARTLSSIGDPTLLDVAGRSYNNQLLLLMSKNKNSFLKEWESFSPEELMMIGLNFQQMYDIESSIKFYTYAMSRSPQQSMVQIEASRQLGKSYFMPSEFQNVAEGRKYYKNVLQTFADSNNLRQIGQEVLLRSEWGFFEMAHADWKCGEIQTNRAMQIIGQWQHALNDRGNMARLIQSNRDNFSPKPGQPTQGCG